MTYVRYSYYKGENKRTGTGIVGRGAGKKKTSTRDGLDHITASKKKMEWKTPSEIRPHGVDDIQHLLRPHK